MCEIALHANSFSKHPFLPQLSIPYAIKQRYLLINMSIGLLHLKCQQTATLRRQFIIQDIVSSFPTATGS
jgi:hypothetical protein